MSTCSIHSHGLGGSNNSFNEEGHLRDNLLSLGGPGILQQNSEELKRTKNRLAQRKHRQRKKAEEQRNSDSPRETRSRKPSAAARRAPLPKETQDGRLQNFEKEAQRFRTDSVNGQHESRVETFGDTPVSATSNRELLPMIDGLDFSLLHGSNDMFDTSQSINVGRSISPQFYSTVFTGPSNAPPFFNNNNSSPNIFDEHFPRQSMPKIMPLNCECTQQSAISPSYFTSKRPEPSRQHQIPTPQYDVTEEQQNICFQATSEEPFSRTGSTCTTLPRPSFSEQEKQDWQNQGLTIATSNSPRSRVPDIAQPQPRSGSRLPTPIDSAPSSTTKSPLFNPPSVHSSVQPPPPEPHPHPRPPHPVPQSDILPLEKRFERIFDAIEEAGFSSIDTMVASYYTSAFPPMSLCASAQSLSRRRHLRRLLEDIQGSASSWDSGEAQGWQEGIMKSATGVFVDEVKVLKERGGLGTGGGVRNCARRFREGIMGAPGVDEETARLLRDEKRIMREWVPENWSLLTELARTAGLSQAEGSQAACLFLCMLMG